MIQSTVFVVGFFFNFPSLSFFECLLFDVFFTATPPHHCEPLHGAGHECQGAL